MGILDDAIREHLELKRRAGADPGEIARLEREAFGAGEAGSTAPPVNPAEGAVAVHEPEPEPAAAVEPYAPEPILPEPHDEPEPHHEPAPAPPPPDEDLDQPTRQFTAQELEEAEREHEPHHEPEPEPVSPAPAAPPPREGEAAEHDELEDTPDFLQETPEHDRLWFEQKPPKDFDF